MKKLLLLTVLISFASCSVSKSPEWVRMDSLKAESFSFAQITLVSDAVFYNPNDIGCTLVDSDIKVFVNGVEVGTAKQNKEVKAVSKGEFIVPLTVNFSPKKLIKSNADLLNGTLSKILKEGVEVNYIGTFSLKKSGIPFTIPIEYEDNLKLL